MAAGRQRADASTSTTYLQVQRTARIVLIGTISSAVRELWICCHGYSQLASEFAHDLGVLAAPDRLIVVPEALNRYYKDDRGGEHGPDHPVGATWMTREERLHEIDDYCAYLDTVYRHFARQLPVAETVCALGFSQGSQTIARWAARTQHRIDHVILWGAGPPQEIQPAPGMFGAARLTLVAGERDRYATAGIDGVAQALDSAGVAFRVERFAGGHRLDDDTLRTIAARID